MFMGLADADIPAGMRHTNAAWLTNGHRQLSTLEPISEYNFVNDDMETSQDFELPFKSEASLSVPLFGFHINAQNVWTEV